MAAAAVGLYGPKVTMGGAALMPPWREDGKGKYAGEPIVIVGGATSVGQCSESLSAYICCTLTSYCPVIVCDYQ